jgi:hypothetical protein
MPSPAHPQANRILREHLGVDYKLGLKMPAHLTLPTAFRRAPKLPFWLSDLKGPSGTLVMLQIALVVSTSMVVISAMS